jgi:hypothetical protein
MIFKQGSCAEELFEGMQNAQQEALLEESQQYDQLVFAAMQALNNAAESFERVGRTARAEEVTAVMISLADSTSDVEFLPEFNQKAHVMRFYSDPDYRKNCENFFDKTNKKEAENVFKFLGLDTD